MAWIRIKNRLRSSFDAAWGDEFTEGILDILDTYGRKGYFLSGGFLVERISGGR